LTGYRFCDGWALVKYSNVNPSRRLFILRVLKIRLTHDSPDIEAHPETNLPMPKSGMTLSRDAEAAYQRLLGERAEMVGQALKGMVPHWWDASVVVPKGGKSKGEKRAARRERERLEGVVGDVGGFGIGEGGVEGGQGGGQGEGDGEEMEVEGEDGGVLI